MQKEAYTDMWDERKRESANISRSRADERMVKIGIKEHLFLCILIFLPEERSP